MVAIDKKTEREATNLLKKTLRILSRFGGRAWGKGDFEARVEEGKRSFACYCLVGGLRKADDASPNMDIHGPAYMRAVERLEKLLPAYYRGRNVGAASRLIQWNDSPRRKHADVVKLLQGAIAA